MIGHCPKCGSHGQVNDVCKLCGEHYIHQNSEELSEASQHHIQKILKLYHDHPDNDIVIRTKSTTKIIIAVMVVLSLIVVITLLLNRERDPQIPHTVSAERQTSVPVRESIAVQETPAIKEAPVIPPPRIEDTRKISNDDNDKTDSESKSPSDEPRQITKADILSAMRASGAQLRTCARTSTIKGVMKVSFVITPKGDVKNVKTVSPEFFGQPVDECITKVISGMKFPQPENDFPVSNYPILIK